MRPRYGALARTRSGRGVRGESPGKTGSASPRSGDRRASGGPRFGTNRGDRALAAPDGWKPRAAERHRVVLVVVDEERDPSLDRRRDLFEEVADALVDVVVTDRRRNRGDEAECSRDQGFSDRRRNDGERCAL